jgi:hypothetical protein
MTDYFFYFLVGVCCGGIGNCLGDMQTLRDCATKSEARMVGGGTIECTVKKEKP